MSQQWYYEHQMKKVGPVSSQQLRALADQGHIKPTDTIWKEGVEQGVAAVKVKNLFAAPPVPPPEPPSPAASDAPAVLVPPEAAATAAEPPNPAVATEPAPEPTGEASAAEAAPAPEAAKPPTPPRQQHAKKARANALRGLVITSQDGSHVQFRKKCVVCGHEDPNKMRIPIKNGMNRVSFFCTKCKKMRQAEFQGVM